jgi:hypothetical protein
VQQDRQHKDERSWKLVMQPHQAPTTHLVIFKQLLNTKIAQTYFLELKRSLRELLPVPLIEAKERYPQLYVPPMPAHLHMPPESLDLAGNLLIRVIINSARAKGQKISIEVFGHSAGAFVGIWLCNRILAVAEEQMLHAAYVSGLNFPHKCCGHYSISASYDFYTWYRTYCQK